MAIDPTLRDALSAVTPASLARALARAGVKACTPHGLSARGSATVVGAAYTMRMIPARDDAARAEEHAGEPQSPDHLVCLDAR